jgi:electron transport complex protein RnfD
MAKKVMLLPSVRSKFVKDDNMKLIFRSLLVLALFMIFANYYMYSFMYGIKLLFMVIIAIVVTRETEILFYSHDKELDREASKELVKKSYPEITAILFALMIPIGTPLWLTALGAVLATLLGKLIFGGFHHMVFHSSLVGVMFVTMGWRQLVSGVAFSPAFDNDLIKLIFDNKFFNETLSIGSKFNPLEYVTSLEILKGGLTAVEYNLLLEGVFTGLLPGIVGSGLVILGIFIVLVIKKAINWILPTVFIASFLVTAAIIALSNGYEAMYPVFQLFSGSVLFVAVFILTDPITTPVPDKGKIIFGVIAGALTMIIRNGSANEEGVIFAVMFMMMLTPMINAELKKKTTPKKAIPKAVVPKEEGA